MKDQAMHLCLTEQLEADPAASLIAAQHREDHSRNLLLLRFRVTLPLAIAERFREAVAIPPAQGQSRAPGAESRAESGSESLQPLRHPSQTIAQIEGLAEGCRKPIPGMYWLIGQYLTSADPPCSAGFPIKAIHRES
jgi:hypothetical protein